MRQPCVTLHVALLFLVIAASVRAQDNSRVTPSRIEGTTPAVIQTPSPINTVGSWNSIFGPPPSDSATSPQLVPQAVVDVAAMQDRMRDLNRQLFLVQATSTQDDKLKTQVDILQKQIDVQ